MPDCNLQKPVAAGYASVVSQSGIFQFLVDVVHAPIGLLSNASHEAFEPLHGPFGLVGAPSA
jgi:hypothetical protein